ncbi:MAG: hypothetical protein JKY96_04745 [Phycisphaerales bacterium]|nr:hypothetical protein [Phycisphaerales bacterium]
MPNDHFERTLFGLINESAVKLEIALDSDVIFYHGGMFPQYFREFRDFIEAVKSNSERDDGTISVVLRTGGGVAETTEQMVAVLRKHYKYVNFVVPDFAMSAGTIFCMSGDKIYMDYASGLGPIDPQVPSSTGEYVPAMGYLDKVEEIARKDNPAPADVILLKSLDLARLARYEQARNLSIDLLESWLVEYKFKDWNVHRTNNPGTEVTKKEKIDRAIEIATILADHRVWRSHGRYLDVVKLRQMRLEIDDYSDDPGLTAAIRGYNDPLTGYVDRTGLEYFFHSHLI